MPNVQIETGSKLATVRLVDNSQVSNYGPKVVYGASHLVIKPYQKVRYTLIGSPERTRTATSSTIYVAIPSGSGVTAVFYRIS
jgi:hypothetical protein